jgi:hypothetical protein
MKILSSSKQVRYAALIVACCLGGAAWAADLYPTDPTDAVMQSARPGEYYFDLGVTAVRNRDYKHALDMYQIAASWAHKAAEYNLGVMYAKGEGVGVDLPRAMAWMTLAAERNDKRYVQARDVIASNLDKAGMNQAEQILRDELLPDYGDAVALGRAKRHWREVRNEATGSHVGFTGDVSVGMPSGGRFMAVQNIFGATPMSGGSVGLGPNVLAGQAKNPGLHLASELTGTTGVPGATAYLVLRQTDDPYDPRFGYGMATVGPLTPAGEKKEAPAEKKENP